jgi:hypothetical protein
VAAAGIAVARGEVVSDAPDTSDVAAALVVALDGVGGADVVVVVVGDDTPYREQGSVRFQMAMVDPLRVSACWVTKVCPSWW